MTASKEYTTPSSSLEGCRTEIDKIDDSIIELLNQRATIALVADSLKVSQIWRTDNRREDEIIERLASSSDGPLTLKDVASVYFSIFETMKSIQSRSREG